MSARPLKTRRRLLVPEVVQTSAMDCGPAALKCLLEGFGTRISYGRLREACQTDVDGTSIDTLEEVARQLGLEAEQIMLPPDHLLLPQGGALPAIIVVRLSSNATHFVVAWRRHGRFIQLMDPATGRRWTTDRQFLDEVYVHATPVPAAEWRVWAGSAEFLDALRAHLAGIGIAGSTAKRLVEQGLADPGWRSLAALDAATRMVSAVVRSGGIRPGRQAAGVIKRFAALEHAERSSDAATMIPAEFWSARAAPTDTDETIEEGEKEEQVLLRGAVLVRVRARRLKAPRTPPGAEFAADDAAPVLSPELVAALAEPSSRPVREIIKLLRADGLLTPMMLILAFAVAACGVIVEAMLFRGLFDIGRDLVLAGQRLGAFGALIVFVAALMLLELPIAAAVLRYGRHLETRLRAAFMRKIPRLGDRYFHSRLTSDMAERSHSVHRVRELPLLAGRFCRSSFELILTAAGVIWLDPAGAPAVVAAAVLAVGLPLAAQPTLIERDLRVRNHNGGLSRFYLDALLGLFAVRAHGAERALRREHESLLVEWASAYVRFQRAVVGVEGLQLFAAFALSAWLLFGYVAREGQASGLLLLIYWALNIPVIGQEIALIARQFPDYRNVTLRLLEPLGAKEEAGGEGMHGAGEGTATDHSTCGIAVALEGVSVRAAGHTILEDIDLSITPGEHVAIVGSSGAGKSSLVGLLLGWHRPATGRLLIDGVPLSTEQIEGLRGEVAWVDPAVQLWNRSLLENLRYGASPDDVLSVSSVIERADLIRVLEKLPDGLQTALGEGGALVSGGEGQRVRLGRAMLRPGVRLVILDEPFRGLELEHRRALLARARELWRGATLLCITHDIGETRTFDRVIVVHDGRIAEDDDPARLAGCRDSRYKGLLDAEEEVRQRLWANGDWRYLKLENGRVTEDTRERFADG